MAAASAAVVEVMPWSRRPHAVFDGCILPGLITFAAAAGVSKARCEVDAQAASSAASRGLVTDDEMDIEADPNKMVVELLTTTLRPAPSYQDTHDPVPQPALGMLLQKIGKKVAR